MDFLVRREKEEGCTGLFVSRTADFKGRYHASYCGAVGLLDSLFSEVILLHAEMFTSRSGLLFIAEHGGYVVSTTTQTPVIYLTEDSCVKSFKPFLTSFDGGREIEIKIKLFVVNFLHIFFDPHLLLRTIRFELYI
jgi:hypothetical protein